MTLMCRTHAGHGVLVSWSNDFMMRVLIQRLCGARLFSLWVAFRPFREQVVRDCQDERAERARSNVNCQEQTHAARFNDTTGRCRRAAMNRTSSVIGGRSRVCFGGESSGGGGTRFARRP